MLQMLPLIFLAGLAHAASGEALAVECNARLQAECSASQTPAVRDVALQAGDSESLGLIQRRGAARRAGADLPGKPQELLPIRWVHVPKCGSSFINTLIHLPHACPSYSSSLYVSTATFGLNFLLNFSKLYNFSDNCPGLEDQLGHTGIGERGSKAYTKYKGHYMIMLREPEERLMSAYKDMKFTWIMSENGLPQGKFNLTNNATSWGGWPKWELADLPTYAKFARGCAVRMLTRSGHSCSGSGGPPTPREVRLAKKRLVNDFSFVGLTSEWSLSMCLFDAMFQTGCHAVQFSDTRPGIDKMKGGSYNSERLKGVKDPYDTELYEEAVRVFSKNLRRYNVSESTCQACWRSAGLSLAAVKSEVLYENEEQ